MVVSDLKSSEMILSFTMLIGLPASGKTTWIKSQAEHFNKDARKTVVASSDNYIDMVAMDKMKTYNEVFAEAADDAQKWCRKLVEDGVRNNYHIIWDQTNLSVKARRAKLSMIPKRYFKKAVVLHCQSTDNWADRLSGRPGKTIPDHVLTMMAKQFEPPTMAEGFDDIEFIFN